MTQSDEANDAARDYGCREWVDEELRSIRAEFAAQLETRRIQVGSDDGPHVVITADGDMAKVRVIDPTGAVSVELLAGASPETPNMAGLALVSEENEYSSLLVIQASPRNPAICELVFDDPSRPGGSTVLDRAGLRVGD